MALEVIGPHPFERDDKSGQQARIGTLFTGHGVLFTRPPEVHAWQRSAFIDHLNAKRAAEGGPPLAPAEEEAVAANSVDLIFDAEHILIRPDPERLDLAFAADELLQGLCSKRQIKFLSISDPRVRQGIKERGEYWRLTSIPKTQEGKHRILEASRVGIQGLPLYLYNRLTGTRWLTLEAFEGLAKLDEQALALHLDEIARYSAVRNRLGRPELDFFAADPRCFGAGDFGGGEHSRLNPAQVRSKYEALRRRFQEAVPGPLRKDDCRNPAWCERMLSALFLDGNETETEHILSGLSPEFFLQIEWLPGGRFEEGEFLFDPIFDEAAAVPGDPELRRLCDLRSKGIILNLIRDFGDVDYINVGCLPESLSIERPQREGRRAVYLVELKVRDEAEPLRRFVRLQKWGVWEHLDEGKDLLRAIQESDDYTDYWLDRRLGCRQLGMNLCRRVVMRRLTEVYTGSNAAFRDQLIRTTYFEREYLPGIATDKLPPANYLRPGYAIKLAELLGRAAASSLVVGRSFQDGAQPLFDDGDELVCEGRQGLPVEVLVADHSGSFGEYKRPLDTFAPHYARPVNSRAGVVPDPKAFASTYLEALAARLDHIQGDYRKRRRAFDTLFKHSKYDTAGSFAFRWECILRRLAATDMTALVAAIRGHMAVSLSP
jgi:hypothetical protein